MSKLPIDRSNVCISRRDNSASSYFGRSSISIEWHDFNRKFCMLIQGKYDADHEDQHFCEAWMTREQAQALRDMLTNLLEAKG